MTQAGPVPWMLAGPGAADAAAGHVGSAADEVDRVAARLWGLLVDSAESLGWRGTAADAASARSAHTSSQLRQATTALRSAQQALGDMARTLAAEGPELESLKRRADDIEGRLQVQPRPLVWVTPGEPTPLEELAGVQARMQGHLDALTAADARVTSALRDVAGRLGGLSSLVAEDGWLADAAPPGVLVALASHGLVDSAGERALLDRALCLPATPQGAEELRGWLSRLPPERAAAFLRRHPDLARRLAGPMPPAAALPPGSDAARLAAVLSASVGLPAKERVVQVRAFFADLDDQQAQRLAVLYAGVVGNLDGAPLPARITANHVKITVALADERARHADLVLAADRDRHDPLDAALSHGSVSGFVADVDTPAKELAHSTSRIQYYERLLGELFDNTGYRPGVPGRPARHGHQIIYFDPSGDGTIAEMWGQVDSHTRHVGVFVPGTTAKLEGGSFEGYSLLASRLAMQDRTGGTTTIAWLGSDAPDSIAADAPDPRYAEAAGPRLRDFVWGVDVPPTADSTVIGHSYGGAVVGVSDREGLEVTRVLHIESAGAGRDVWSLDDYNEQGRPIAHYSMTAPGDAIVFARTGKMLQDEFEVGHGGDPDSMEGFTRLETGRFDDVGDPARRGALIEGVGSHSTVLTPGSTAWNNIYAVVTGGRAVPYQEPSWTWRKPSYGAFPVPARKNPYEDPHFEPSSTVPVQ